LNADVTFSLKKDVSDYIIKRSEFTAKKVYVVIVNNDRTTFTSDILMFNEKDTRTLIHGSPFEMYYFLSQRKYTFNFTSGNNSVIDVSLSNEIEKNKHNVEFYNTTTGNDVLIVSSKNNSFRYTFKDEVPGTYKIVLSSDQPAYTLTRKIIQVERKEGELADFKENIPLIYNMIVTRPLYIKKVLSNYKSNEFGIVTLYLSNDLLGIFKGIYGKIVVAEDNETELIDVSPKSKEENEFLVEPLSDGQHFHLHFKVTKKPEGNKQVILLVTVDLEEGFSYFIPKQVTVGLSEKREIVTLGDLTEDEEYEYKYYVVSHIPKIITFRWFVGNSYSAYIFLSPGEGYCIFYNGSYINNEGSKINEDQNDNLLFALPTGRGAPFKTQSSITKGYLQDVDVKFMTPTGNHSIKVVKVLGPVIFKEGVRKENSYQFEINDCTYPAYFIESYDSVINAWANIQLDMVQLNSTLKEITHQTLEKVEFYLHHLIG
jgi:hypothetical protein